MGAAKPSAARKLYSPLRSRFRVMLRFLYTVAMYLATPVIVWRLAARGIRYRGYFRRWR